MMSPSTEGRVKFDSVRFGDVEVPASRVLEFPEGLLGFEGVTRYTLLDPGDGSLLRWLHAVDEPALAFVVMEPGTFMPWYEPQLPAEAEAVLGSGDGLLVLVVVTVPRGGRDITANLRAPLFVDPAVRRGYQAILGDEQPTRHRVLPEIADQGLEGSGHAGT